MKDIASMLKRQSSTPQLPSYGHGCIELPNGKRWNPSHIHKFTTRPLSMREHFIKFIGGVHAF